MSQPTHQDVFCATNELCASTISEVESALERQRTDDAVEAIRRQEEETNKTETAREAAERGAYETQERLKKLEQDRLNIEAAEHDLQMRKKALQDAENGADYSDNNDYDVDDGSVSIPETQMVCRPLMMFISLILIIIYH